MDGQCDRTGTMSEGVTRHCVGCGKVLPQPMFAEYRYRGRTYRRTRCRDCHPATRVPKDALYLDNTTYDFYAHSTAIATSDASYEQKVAALVLLAARMEYANAPASTWRDELGDWLRYDSPYYLSFLSTSREERAALHRRLLAQAGITSEETP